jgi:acyl-CoA synthetase (AMP-forming)/AMP-acid ligase II
MLTHLNIVAKHPDHHLSESRPDDVVLSVYPRFRLRALVLMAFKVGATLVLERSFAYPDTVLETLNRERVTGFPIVPTMAAVLLQLDLTQYDLSSLVYITNTAAALPRDHIRRLRGLFPHVKLFSMYGLTSASLPSAPDQPTSDPARWAGHAERRGVRGRGRASGRPGVVGELVVRGSNVMKGIGSGLRIDRVASLFPGKGPPHGPLPHGREGTYRRAQGRHDQEPRREGQPEEAEDVLCSLSGSL